MFEPTDQQALEAWHASQLDHDEPIQAPLHKLHADTVCALLMLICTPAPSGRIAWRTAFRRLSVIASIINPDIGRLTLDRIARDLTEAGLPTTRAALSATSCQLRDIIGFTRSDKSERARESYRERSSRVWGRKTNRNRKTTKKESESVDSQ